MVQRDVGRLPLPQNTARQVTRALRRGSVSNFGLLFQCYIDYDQRWTFGKDKKKKIFRALEEEFNSSTTEIGRSLLPILRALNRRVEMDAKSSTKCKARSLEGEVRWRMAVGLGEASVLETGLTLHHVYGFPYLPSSSSKGLARGYALARLAEQLGVGPLDADSLERRKERGEATPLQMLETLLTLDPRGERREDLKERLLSDEALAEDAPIRENPFDELEEAEDFRRAFGSTERKGEVRFFDAYPVSTPKLEMDVMTPHYGPYYTEGEPPADYHSPVPVYFLTLAEGTRFRFWWVSREDHLLDRVEAWLKAAMIMFGVGAKTRAGYGQLKPRRR